MYLELDSLTKSQSSVTSTYINKKGSTIFHVILSPTEKEHGNCFPTYSRKFS